VPARSKAAKSRCSSSRRSVRASLTQRSRSRLGFTPPNGVQEGSGAEDCAEQHRFPRAPDEMTAECLKAPSQDKAHREQPGIVRKPRDEEATPATPTKPEQRRPDKARHYIREPRP
jgi:hypothetical protein